MLHWQHLPVPLRTFRDVHIPNHANNGNQLVKTFSDDMKTITSVLKDADGTVIVTEIKTFSEDGLTISTDVVYG